MSELRYQDHLPLAWTLPPEPLTDAELDRLERANERLLRLLPGLESPADADDDAPPPRHLQILDLRLQLLTELLGELLTQSHPLPPRVPVALTARQVSWLDDRAPEPQASIVVELYLHDAFPRPIRLPAKVILVQPEQGRARITAETFGLGEAVSDQLHKLVFRQHRRAVASQRGRAI